jgi:C4-dicarboxylate-specific signal transduction histidine kinase
MTASGDFSLERLRLVEELAAGVAHEVNNPLQSVLNNAYLIEASTEQPNISGYATEIQRTSAVLSQLMTALFDLLRPERAARAIDVAQVVDGGLVLFGYALRNAQASVRLQIDEGVLRVNADPGMLQLALLDILRATLDGEKRSGEIQKDKLITLCVARAPSAVIEFSTKVRGATEPACYLARTVAERCGGAFRCEATPEAAGSCQVVFSLPAA